MDKNLGTISTGPVTIRKPGFILDEEPEDSAPTQLPQPRAPVRKGFVLDDPITTTPEQRDQAKMVEAAGQYHVPDKTPEELKSMSIRERMQYIQDLQTQREFLNSSQFVKGTLSGASFGATENIEALKPIKFEEANILQIPEVAGQLVGSYLPLSGMIKVSHLATSPVMKMITKSPVIQKNVGALLSMFGVGMADSALHQVAKGEIPSPIDALQNGGTWAALDVALKTLGVGGRFAAGMMRRASQTGTNRLEMVNRVANEVKVSGATTPEQVAAKALEVIEGPLSEAEKLAAQERTVQLAQREQTEMSKLAQQTLGQPVSQGKQAVTSKSQPSQPPGGLGIQYGFADLGQGISDSFYKQGFESLQKGRTSIAGMTDDILVAAKPNFDNGLIKSADDLKKFTDFYYSQKYPSQGTATPQVAQGTKQFTVKKGAPGTPSEQTQAVSRVQAAAQAEPGLTPKDIKTRVIEDRPVNQLTKKVHELSEPYKPLAVDLVKEAAALENTAIQGKINQVGTRAASMEVLGTSIRENVNEALEAAKAEYAPLYVEAERIAHTVTHVPTRAINTAINRLLRLASLRTRPAGYNAVIENLEGVLEDLGATATIAESLGVQAAAGVEIPVSRSIEVARRLNEIVTYEAIEPTVKDVLKKEVLDLKADIRTGLVQVPDALAAFELAEAQHAVVAQRFGRDSIKSIRGQQAGERVAKMVESPTTFAELKPILSPAQTQQIEREFLEKLNEQTFDKSQKSLREMERHLSAENRKLAREIVESKNPHNPQVRRKLKQEAILDDLSQSLSTGDRPKLALNLWKTPEGQKLVNEALHNSPNKARLTKYLQEQSFEDLKRSVFKSDGTLNLDKFKEFMRDPGTVNNIRMMGGEDAVKFFRNLGSQVKEMGTNLKIIQHFPTEEQIDRQLSYRKKPELARESPGQRKLEQIVSKEKQTERQITGLGKEKLELGPKGKSTRDEQALAAKEQRGGKRLEELAAKENRTERQIGEIGKEKLPTKKTDKEVLEAKAHRGDEILKRMKRKDYHAKQKLEDWNEWIKDTLHLNTKSAISVFGIAKLGGSATSAITTGIPTVLIGLVGYRMMNRLLTSPRTRRAFLDACKKKSDPIKFVLGMEAFGNSIKEED